MNHEHVGSGMNIGGLRVGSLSAASRDSLLAGARAAEVTYDHVGATLDPQRWSHPDVRVRHLDVGSGMDDFRAARHALLTWVPHTGIGAAIEPAGQAVDVGATLLVVLRRGPVHVIAPDRIVAVIDEPRCFAFAYGTLPGHPERGEESFMVELQDDGIVRATIRVQAGTGTLPAHAVAPIVRRLQAAAINRYLAAIGKHVAAPSNVVDPPGGAA